MRRLAIGQVGGNTLTFILLASIFENVTHAPDRLDKTRRKRFIHFLPQSQYRDIDDVGVALEIDVPHLLRNKGAAEDLSVVGGEEPQSQELLRRQVDPLSRPACLVPEEIDFEVGYLDGLGPALRAPSGGSCELWPEARRRRKASPCSRPPPIQDLLPCRRGHPWR